MEERKGRVSALTRALRDLPMTTCVPLRGVGRRLPFSRFSTSKLPQDISQNNSTLLQPLLELWIRVVQPERITPTLLRLSFEFGVPVSARPLLAAHSGVSPVRCVVD